MIIISLLSITVISAQDNPNDVQTLDTIDDTDIDNEITLKESTQEEPLSESPGTFKELSDLISKGGTINLTKDYQYSNGDPQISISKQVTINGNGHVIDGQSKNIFDIRSSNVVLNNITFINGYYGYGGAITSSASGTTIANCTFKDNSAYYGGGAIASYGSNLKVDNCVFENNKLGVQKAYWNEGGGAIYAVGSDSIISNSKFVGNQAFGYGAAIFAGRNQYGVWASGSNIQILNSTFLNNVGGSGSAIRLDSRSGKIDGCNFINNVANRQGGGAVYITHLSASVSNSYFESNKANRAGGGLHVEADFIRMNNLTFINNSAATGGGAYIVGYDDTSDSENSINSITNSRFINNTAVYGGGGIGAVSQATLRNLTLIGNTAGNYGGGASIANSALYDSNISDNNGYYGGGVYTYNSEIADCTFNGNSAELGNSIYVVETSDISKGNDLLDTEVYKNIDGLADVNSTKGIAGLHETAEGYYGFCAEERNFSPYNGEYDSTLELLRNSITGEKIADYLKILIYKYIDDFNSLNNTDFSNLIWAFSDHDFRSSSNPIIQDVVKLYDSGFRVPTVDASKIMDNDIIMYFNFTSLITPSAQQNLFMFKFSYGKVINETLTKETLNKTSYVGDEVQFRLTVKNNGNEPLYQVFISDDDYSKGLEYKSWVNETGNWTYVPGMKHWVLDKLDAKQSASIILTFKVLTNGTLYNNATAGIADKNVTNATNSTEAHLQNFTIEKITLNEIVELGEKVEFKIVVKNTGDTILENIVVTEDEFDGMSYDSFTGPEWTHKLVNGKHQFTLKTLDVGDNSSFIVKFKTLKAGTLRNTVVSNSSKTANNTTEVIDPSPDTNITKNPNDDDDIDEPEITKNKIGGPNGTSNNTDIPNPPSKHQNQSQSEKININSNNTNISKNKNSATKTMKIDNKTTGNPILVLLLAMILLPIKRKF